MTNKELAGRLAELPDVYEGFVICACAFIEQYDIEDEVLELLDSNNDATTEDVLFLIAAQNNFEPIPIIDD